MQNQLTSSPRDDTATDVQQKLSPNCELYYNWNSSSAKTQQTLNSSRSSCSITGSSGVTISAGGAQPEATRSQQMILNCQKKKKKKNPEETVGCSLKKPVE